MTRHWLLGPSEPLEAGSVPGREGAQGTNRKCFYICISDNLVKEVSEETALHLWAVSNSPRSLPPQLTKYSLLFLTWFSECCALFIKECPPPPVLGLWMPHNRSWLLGLGPGCDRGEMTQRGGGGNPTSGAALPFLGLLSHPGFCCFSSAPLSFNVIPGSGSEMT